MLSGHCRLAIEAIPNGDETVTSEASKPDRDPKE
jgi:hypothetical protein